MVDGSWDGHLRRDSISSQAVHWDKGKQSKWSRMMMLLYSCMVLLSTIFVWPGL